MPAPDLTERFSARLKNLYIELHDYAYFHSPSELGDIDPRFTGRTEVLDRLKSLFTDYQTPSGAYLVTGYRGAGKSSLVARALSEISSGIGKHRRASRMLRLWVPLAPLALLGGLVETPLFLGLFALVGLILFFYLLANDPRLPDVQAGTWGLWRQIKRRWRPARTSAELRQKGDRKNVEERPVRWSHLKEWLPLGILHTLHLGKEPPPRGRARMLLQDLFILICIILLGAAFNGLWPPSGFLARFFVYAGWLLLFLLGNTFGETFVDLLVERGLVGPPRPSLRQPVELWKSLWKSPPVAPVLAVVTIYLIGKRWLRLLACYLRYSSRVYIKVNLSQDAIQEIDILRLIAKSIYLKYRTFAGTWRTDLPWKIVRFLLIVLVVWVVYDLNVTRELNHGVERELHVACYFPSQGVFLLRGGLPRYFRVVEALQRNQNLTAETLVAALDDPALRKAGMGQSGMGHNFSHSHRTGVSGEVQRYAMMLTIYADTFVQYLYRQLLYQPVHSILEALKIVDPVQAGAGKPPGAAFSVADMSSRHLFLPQYIDYLFLGYLCLFWSLGTMLVRWRILGWVSHRMVLDRLEELNEMIESQVTREQGGGAVPASSLLVLNFGRRKSKTSPVLTERAIEKHLLEILALIERIPRVTVRPEFFIIFDELDKIQHHENFTLTEKSEALDEYQGREFTSVEAERERQHRILALVSNLKHFLTTAPVKFIFIAGREMFDASLADVSDRHFFMGSVFNEVLHVPSFHTDNSDDRLPDITSLTEQYLCRFLLPKAWQAQGLTLQVFLRYLEEDLRPGEGSLVQREREKIIFELHNFITYITYRSNGAPKKITKAIERYLVRLEPDLLEEPDAFIVGKSSKSFYLRFNYYDQYAFGLITYLGSPLIFSLNRAIKDYGDKILVSSSFLLDHVYKFHGHGFSWRNLELLPEIVDINRAPQLRELIGYILQFLAKSDISQIVSGLYDFKFTRRITEEISFLSKISEHESAAFNFTLDESLAIKRHFNRKLQRLLKTYGDYPNYKPERFVNSIAFVRMILGDLHFYDGELDAAIIEYMEAVQSLRGLPAKKIRGDILVLMIRNYLKLGLAFERKKSYDSAFVTYGKIVATVTDLGDLSSGLNVESGTLDREYRQSVFAGSRLILQPLFAKLQLIEKSTLGGVSESDIDGVVNSFERMIPQHMTAERFLLHSEFWSKMGDILFFKNGPMQAKPYCYEDDALCSKNGKFGRLFDVDRRRLPCHACRFYHRSLGILCRDYLEIPEPGSRSRVLVEILEAFEKGRLPADRKNALLELARTLSVLGDTFVGCAGTSVIGESFLGELLHLIPIWQKWSEHGPSRSGEVEPGRPSVALAGVLGSAAEDSVNKVEEALSYFVVASLLFRQAGNSRASALELNKILWVVRDALVISKATLTERSRTAISTILVPAALEQSYRSHEGTHRLEIEKLKEVFEKEGQVRALVDSVNLGRLSIGASVMETLVVFDEIELSLRPKDKPYPLDHRCSPYAMFQGVFSRIHLLRLRSGIHYRNLRVLGLVRSSAKPDATPGLNEFSDRKGVVGEGLGREDAVRVRAALLDGEFKPEEFFPELSKDEASKLTILGVVEFILTDAIYCCHEIMRFMAIYGSSYMASHSMRAAAHQNLALWCDVYYGYLRVEKEWLAHRETLHRRDWTWLDESLPRSDRLEARLRQLVGQADLVDLSPGYHCELAQLHFRAAKEAHSEGKAYTELLEKMFYLNDDFADQLEHFCAALERFSINSGQVDKKLQSLRKRLGRKGIYQASLYSESGGARAI